MACKNTWKNAVLLEEKRCDIFEKKRCDSSWGTPIRSRLAKCCFCNGSRIKKEFKKMKWHVKIHAKMPFYQKEREVTFFLLWGYPYAL